MVLKVFGAAFDAMKKISANIHYKTLYAVVVKQAVQAKNSLKYRFSFFAFFILKIESVELMKVLIQYLSLFV